MRQDAASGFIIIILCLFLLVCLCLPNHLLVASPSSSFSCRPDQRDALLGFKQSLSITGPKVASWREDEDCCSWEGVTCDNSTGDVIFLYLTSAGLRGSIDSSSPLFSLRHLRLLSLSGNDLLGSAVPPEIGVLSRLEYLDLSHSNISGILPMEISYLTKLISLDLSHNYGNWPEMEDATMRMLVSNLTRLEELNLTPVYMLQVTPASFTNLSSSLISLQLSNCLLGGKFPEFIFGLPNLRVIDISWNSGLTGTLPESKWSPSLYYLSLGSCNFTGAVPNSIGNLSHLTQLDLSYNYFMGAVPNSIGNLSRLTHLDLSYNIFDGGFELRILSSQEDLYFLSLSNLSVSGEDTSHGFSLPQLQELYMVSCNLSKFPSFLSRSMELRSLLLTGNKIQEIPSWFWNIGIDTLTDLSLEDNIVTGSIPPFICRLTSLSFLDLSINNFTGIIPRCLGNLTNLRDLGLSYNALSGPLPPSLANCTSLSTLFVDYNSIAGAPPTWLSSSIYDISLRDNNFEGQWPRDIFLRSTSLKNIDLSDNKLEGPLPLPSYATASYLVSGNHFSGNMSSLFCNATDLWLLDLSNNGLTGTLPDCLENITASLRFLNLRENEFSGQIPEIFHEGSPLKSADLSRNQFEGLLPRSLSQCKSLEALDVGSNKIAGPFPNWLGNLPLKVLSLRSNRFHGRVVTSKETLNFSQVHVMDLSNNSFEGNITDKFIGELVGMTGEDIYNYPDQYMVSESYNEGYYSVMIVLKGVEMEMVKINVRFAVLDLSSNRFRGEIPKSIGVLKSLRGLNLSHNGFTGMIPPSLGKLKNVESLDLSSNHLMGEIPKELEQLQFLGVLDLSRNNLTGPIPLGGQFNTFSNGSFQGNPGLCGIPLTRSCDPGNKGANPLPKGKDGGEEEGGGGWLEWKYVAMGFGSGMGMGITLGYMVLEIGRPLWLVRLVIRLEASYRKMSKRKGDRRRNGRR